MRFKVKIKCKNTDKLSEEIINADNLDEAEAICNKRFNKPRSNWIEIRYANIKDMESIK
jgi:hypothetical protein